MTQAESSSVSWVEPVIRARFLVASFGETASPPWWRTEATSPVAQRVLQRLFPRTALAASLETAGRAAAREHDARIGRSGAYHLFRLPAADEVAIHELLRSRGTDELLQPLAALSDAARLDALDALADGAGADSMPGPVQCGSVDDVRRGDDALRQMCAVYVAAFRSGQPAYPYLVESEP